MQDGLLLQKFNIDNSTLEIFIPYPAEIKKKYREKSESFISPYWAKVWPAAIGLCLFLKDNLHFIKNKNVLELAAGLGLPGIFSAPFAKQICISDIEPAAVNLLYQTVDHNKLINTECKIIDWTNFESIKIPEVILLSDVNYEPSQFEILEKAILHFLNHQCTIILSTPQRLTGRDFIKKLLVFCKEQSVIKIDYENVSADINIFVLKK